MNKFRRFLPDALITLLLFAVPLAFLWQQTIGGRTVIPAENLFQWQPYAALADEYHAEDVHNGLVTDLILQYYTWQKFSLSQISQGELPQWQPNILAGTPFMGAGQPQTTYPLSIIYLILPLWLAFGWYSAIHLGIAGLNVYILSRALRLRRAGGVVAALTYQLSAFLLAALVFPTVLAVAAWLPFCLAMIEKVTCEPEPGLRGKLVVWVALGAVGLGMASLAGHVEAMYFTLLVMGFFAAWRTLTSPPSPLSANRAERGSHDSGDRGRAVGLFWQRVIGLGVMAGLGLALGSAMIVPAYELATKSFREGAVALEQVREWAYPPRQILSFLMPNFYGNPTHHQIFDLFTWQWTPVTTNAAGNPISTTEWGIKNYVEGAAYVGILPLVMAALGVIGWGRTALTGLRAPHAVSTGADPRLASPPPLSTGGEGRPERILPDANYAPSSPLGFIALGGLAASFVFGLPTYNLLYYGLPFFNQSHAPFRWVWPLTLCIAVLAGYGVHYLAESIEEREDGSPAPLPPQMLRWMGIGGVAVGALIVIGLVVVRVGYDGFAGVVERVFNGMALAPNAFPDARAFFSYEAIHIGVLGMMIAATGGVILLARRVGAKRVSRLNISPWAAAAAAVVVVDLFIGSWGLTPSSDPALLTVTPPSIQWMKDQQTAAPTQPFRFTAYIAPGSTKTMNANTGWLVGLEDVTGYDSLITMQYSKTMEALMPQGDLIYNRIAPIYEAEADALDSPLIDLLGVKYLVSESPVARAGWTQVYQDEAVIIYENGHVLPRAFTMPESAARLINGKTIGELTQQSDVRQFVLVDGACTFDACPADDIPAQAEAADTHGPATITVYKPGELWIDTEMKSAGWLVVADTYFPDWRAYIRPVGAGEDQEQEVPVWLVDGNFRGVKLDEGRWTVRMKYSPDSVRFGLLGSMLAGLALIFLMGVWAWPRLYREEGSGSEAKRVAKNALTPILLNLLTKGISFALTFVMLRKLGPAGTGDYTYAMVIWGWFDIFTNFGLNTYLTREVARNKDKAGQTLATTTLVRLGLAALGIPALASFIAIRQATVATPLNPEAITALWLLYGGLFFSTISTGLTALFYAFEKAEFPAAIQTVSAFLTTALGISALQIGLGITGLAATSIVVNAVTFVILAALAMRMFGINLTPRPPLRKQSREGESRLNRFKDGIEAIRESWPLMLNHLLATLFFRIDVVLLEALKGAMVVGWYRVVYTWVDAIGVIPAFFTMSLFPMMSRQAAEDRPALKRVYVLAIKLMTLLSVPTAIFTTLLASTLVNILGGAEYLPNGAIALQIFIWAMIIGWMNSVTQYVIIALNRQRTLTIAFVVGAAFNVTANLIFIPLYSFVAASVITIFSEAVLWIVFYVILRREMGAINWAAALWRIFAAGIVSAGVAFGAGTISPWIGLVGGVIAYGVVLVIIKPLDGEESKLFAGLLPDGIRRRVGIGQVAEGTGS